MIGKVLFAASLAGGFVASELVRGPAENHPWRVLWLLAGAAAVAGVAWFFAGSAWWLAAIGVLLGGAGFGLVEGWDNRDNYLTPYCAYGARSEAERERCLSTVRSEDVDALDTPAARFARGETSECGADSGPLCAEEAGARP